TPVTPAAGSLVAASEGAKPPQGYPAAQKEADDASNDVLARVRQQHALPQQLEALLLVADEPLSAVSLATATDRPVREVRRAIDGLIADYDGDEGRPARGFELREVA